MCASEHKNGTRSSVGQEIYFNVNLKNYKKNHEINENRQLNNEHLQKNNSCSMDQWKIVKFL